MILIDDREGSKDFLKPLQDALVPCELTRLDFGDFAFLGRGEKGAEVSIGVEHKKLADLVSSLEGRLPGHQLPGLVTDYDRPYLIIEGEWTHDKDGKAVSFIKDTHRKRKVPGIPQGAVAFEQRLLCLATRGGLHIRHTNTRRDSVRFLIALYRYWTDKDLDQHKSHLAIHAPDMDSALGIPVSPFRRAVAQLPGIGFKTSAAVEKQFGGSFRRMMLAPEEVWAEIVTTDDAGKTRRIGPSRAKQIMEALR
jgi:ERCC4-type nuclease